MTDKFRNCNPNINSVHAVIHSHLSLHVFCLTEIRIVSKQYKISKNPEVSELYLTFCLPYCFVSCNGECNVKSDLEGNFAHVVLPGCDLLHLFLYVFLCGALHIDVITVSTGIVAGDGLEIHTHTRSHTIVFKCIISCLLLFLS